MKVLQTLQQKICRVPRTFLGALGEPEEALYKTVMTLPLIIKAAIANNFLILNNIHSKKNVSEAFFFSLKNATA